MKTFIAFFDILGYKSLVENNEFEDVNRKISHLLRDIEFALSLRKAKRPERGIVTADRSESIVNCLNISDSILFWTPSVNQACFEQIVNVCYELNWKMTKFNLPIRGALTYGELGFVTWDDKNDNSTIYRGNILHGKGLIEAYQLANSMEWSGSLIDNSILNSTVCEEGEMIAFIEKYAVKYKIPYKNGFKDIEDYAFMITRPNFNEEAFRNGVELIRETFISDNKDFNSESARLKLENTINFYKFLKDYGK